MRLFLAVDVPSTVHAAIADATRALRDHLGDAVRWLDPHAVHLTMRFLGEQTGEVASALRQRLAPRVTCRTAFHLRCSGIGAFPSMARPRVVWCGVDPNPWLDRLYDDVEDAVADVGLEREHRAFRPHLTLGRVRRPLTEAEAAALAGAAELQSSERFPVESLHLMRSELSQAGARHERVWSVRLATPAREGA